MNCRQGCKCLFLFFFFLANCKILFELLNCSVFIPSSSSIYGSRDRIGSSLQMMRTTLEINMGGMSRYVHRGSFLNENK